MSLHDVLAYSSPIIVTVCFDCSTARIVICVLALVLFVVLRRARSVRAWSAGVPLYKNIHVMESMSLPYI